MNWVHKRTLLVFVAALVAGCTHASTGTEPTLTSPSASASAGATKPGPVVLDVRIANGDVSPRGARIDVKVGQPVTLAVHSDVAEQIHVHSDPEHEFAVKPGKQQRFTFTMNRPGKVAVEVHHLDAVIAEVLVTR